MKKNIKSKSQIKHNKFFKNFKTETFPDKKTILRKGLEKFEDFKRSLQERNNFNKFEYKTKRVKSPETENVMTQSKFSNTNTNFMRTFSSETSALGNTQAFTLMSSSPLKTSQNNLSKYQDLITLTRTASSKRINPPMSDGGFPLLHTMSNVRHKSKCSSQKTQILNNNNYNETEVTNLLNYYCSNNNFDNFDDEEKIIEKNEILRKFEIGTNKEEIRLEEEKIKEFLNNNNKKIINREKKFNENIGTFPNKIKKTELNFHEKYFNDPISSMTKLNFNREIFERVMGLRNSKQIDLYLEKYATETERLIKNMQMKIVRESPLNPETNEEVYEIPVIKDYDHYQNNFDVKNPYMKQMSRDMVLSNNLEFVVSFSTDSKSKPFARSQFTAILDGGNLIIFGGISGEILYETWICELNNNYLWKKVGLNEDEAPNPRYGHTAVLYRKEMFIYGGVTPKDYFKPKEDILVFNINSNKFFSEKSKGIFEFPWRTNHIAHTIGGVMLIHGGILETGKLTNDLGIFEFSSFRWSMLDHKGKSPYLAFHCSDFVLENEKPNSPYFHIYKGVTNINIDTRHSFKLKHEGIYIFGGIDEENNISNEIFILKVGRKPCEWVKPKVYGMPPVPRMLAKMNFYQELNVLVLHGGRNDTIKKPIFNDIWIFDLENFNWIKASTYPLNAKERAEHISIVNNNKVLILGGINLKKYNSMDFFIMNADLYNNKFKERDIYKEIEVKNKLDKNKKEDAIFLNQNQNILEQKKIDENGKSFLKNSLQNKLFSHELINNYN